MPFTPATLTAEDLVDANLRDSLAGTNAGWLRASLALAQRTDVLALALDAAVLATALSRRAAAQLGAEMCERDRQLACRFAQTSA